MIKINHNIFVALASGCATVPGLTYLVIPSSPLERLKRGKTVLKNALEDKLYAKAYKEGFARLVKRVEGRRDPTPKVGDWQVINDFISAACERLRAISKTSQRCMPDGIPQERGPA
jgi:hypothetical protein